MQTELSALHWSSLQQYPCKIGRHVELPTAMLLLLHKHFPVEHVECQMSLHSVTSLHENREPAERRVWLINYLSIYYIDTDNLLLTHLSIDTAVNPGMHWHLSFEHWKKSLEHWLFSEQTLLRTGTQKILSNAKWFRRQTHTFDTHIEFDVVLHWLFSVQDRPKITVRKKNIVLK